MEPVLLGQVGVGHAIAVGDGELAGVAQVLGGRAADPGPGHGQLAGIGQGHLPVLFVVDRMDREVVRLELDGEVTVHRCIIQEIRLDHFGLVSQAEDEAVKAVMGIGSHDVPEDGTIADGDHGLGANLRLLAQSRPQAAAQNEDGHVRVFSVHRYFPCMFPGEPLEGPIGRGPSIITDWAGENQDQFF